MKTGEIINMQPGRTAGTHNNKKKDERKQNQGKYAKVILDKVMFPN